MTTLSLWAPNCWKSQTKMTERLIERLLLAFTILCTLLEHFLGHDPFASLVYSTHYSGVYMQYISLEIETYILILRNILHLCVARSFLFFFLHRRLKLTHSYSHIDVLSDWTTPLYIYIYALWMTHVIRYIKVSMTKIKFLRICVWNLKYFWRSIYLYLIHLKRKEKTWDFDLINKKGRSETIR